MALIAEQEAITHTPMYEVVPQAAPQQAAATPKGQGGTDRTGGRQWLVHTGHLR